MPDMTIVLRLFTSSLFVRPVPQSELLNHGVVRRQHSWLPIKADRARHDASLGIVQVPVFVFSVPESAQL